MKPSNVAVLVTDCVQVMHVWRLPKVTVVILKFYTSEIPRFLPRS